MTEMTINRKRLTPITRNQLTKLLSTISIRDIELENHPFRDDVDVFSEDVGQLQPGTIGISTAKNDIYMTYCIDKSGELSDTEIFRSEKEAYGDVLKRHMDYIDEDMDVHVRDVTIIHPESGPECFFWTMERGDDFNLLNFELSIFEGDETRPVDQIPITNLTNVLKQDCGNVHIFFAMQDHERLILHFAADRVPNIEPLIPEIVDCFAKEMASMYRESLENLSKTSHIYETKFELTDYVNDFKAAQDYLKEENMSVYLRDHLQNSDRDFSDAISSIDWILQDEISGVIKLTTNRELSMQELSDVSEWVVGQNADGLGEGFEQQPFANYEDPNYDYEEEEEEPFVVMASFDWEHNPYTFHNVTPEQTSTIENPKEETSPLSLTDADLDFARQMNLNEFGLY